MSHEECIFTERDFIVLDTMLSNSEDANPYFLDLLRRKIRSAHVVAESSLLPTVATLGSRVAYSIDGTCAESRVLSQSSEHYPVSACLPISSIRGLALLGLTENQTLSATNISGVAEVITLNAVLYQPEAAISQVAASARPLD